MDFEGALYDDVLPSLFVIRTRDRSLDAASRFSKLKYLRLETLSNWPAEEYMRLYASLPHVNCEELRRAATDADFRRANRIR